MARPKTLGVAIRVYLADGTPQGLRIVERMGWTGLCLAFARADYQDVRQREEMARTGVYLLLGRDAEGHRDTRLYIGEADSVRARIDQHQREKDFWTEGFVLTTTDNSLNKAQVRFLESRLIGVAREVDTATMDNGTNPAVTWLSEPDIAVMESYLDYALTLLPLLGVQCFEEVENLADTSLGSSPTEQGTPPPSADDSAENQDGVRGPLHLHAVSTNAEGRDDARGFIVYEGSTSRRQQNVMIPSYAQLRARMIEEGTLTPINDSQFRLSKNVIFDSPSAAASVLSGGSKNGRIEWKDRNGITLKELQERTVLDAVIEHQNEPPPPAQSS